MAALLRRHSPPYFFYGRHSTLLPFLKGLLPTFIVVRTARRRLAGFRSSPSPNLASVTLAGGHREERTPAIAPQDWIFMRMYGLLELTAAVRRGAVGKLKST